MRRRPSQGWHARRADQCAYCHNAKEVIEELWKARGYVKIEDALA